MLLTFYLFYESTTNFLNLVGIIQGKTEITYFKNPPLKIFI